MTPLIKRSRQALLILAACSLITSLTAQVKVMTIGDSLTEEYYFEFPFSAPSSTPILGFANTQNWVEILAEQRYNDFDFGSYEEEWPFGYGDLRLAGYQYNFGIPGYDTRMWMDILDPVTNPFDPDFDPVTLSLALTTRAAMRETYENVDVIVIMVGGNDVNFQYGDLYESLPGDTFATSFTAEVLGNLGAFIDEIRNHTTDVPIVLADVPDLGVAPDIIADHPDVLKRANASAIINALNTELATLATNRNVTLARISELTDRLLSPDPFYIAGHEMIKDTDPLENNRPEYLFCWQGLHPSTNGQAIIANTLLNAINLASGTSIQQLGNREILENLLGLNPDQPYLDWAQTQHLTDSSMTSDSDGDGIPNLGEYLLGLNPLSVDETHIATFETINSEDYLSLQYTLDTDALRIANADVKYSTNLNDWLEVPPNGLINLNSNSYEARIAISDLPNEGTRAFLRIEFTLRP